jgi:hypothetical protein
MMKINIKPKYLLVAAALIAAALFAAAGGSGALTLGDTGSTTAIISSDWGISATGAATAMASIAFDSGDAALTAVDTLKSGGGVVKWGLFTLNGQVFAAVLAADTARIVD